MGFNRFNRQNITITPRKTPPRRSWWVGLNGYNFYEQAAVEQERMRTERLPNAVAGFFYVQAEVAATRDRNAKVRYREREGDD